MILLFYILREILRPLVLILGGLMVVFLAYSAAVILDKVAGGELVAGVALELIGLQAVIALETLLPTALYLAVIVGLGRFYRDSEMAVMTALGLSELQVMRSVGVLALFAALVVAGLSLYGRPWAYRLSYELEQAAAAKVELERLQAGRFHTLGDGLLVMVSDRMNPGRKQAKGVFVERDMPGARRLIHARSAELPEADPETGRRSVVFKDGYFYHLQLAPGADRILKFGRLSIEVDTQTPEDINSKRKARPTAILFDSDEPKEVAELQWRLSMPVATLLLGFLAVPLSRSSPRRSRHRSLLIAVLVYALILNLTGMARTWVEHGDVPALPGIWWVHGLTAALLLAQSWRRSFPYGR